MDLAMLAILTLQGLRDQGTGRVAQSPAEQNGGGLGEIEGSLQSYSPGLCRPESGSLLLYGLSGAGHSTAQPLTLAFV